MNEEKPKITKLVLEDDLGVAETVVLDQNGPTGESVRRVDTEGHSSGMDQRGNNVQEHISGPTIKGERGTKQTCEILMERLNQDGADWYRVESPTDDPDIDGYLYARRPEIERLPVQVTKADQTIWGELAKNPEGVTRDRNLNAICETLFNSIEKKELVADKYKILLALEAVHFLVSKLVVDRFIETVQRKARTVGFKEIWLVGPTASHTYKLT